MRPRGNLKKINDYLWEIPKSFRSDMRVPARVYATSQMLPKLLEDKSLEQLVNVASLPGIEGYALAMPDAHEGYGFPIGGVAAMRVEDGVISPGGIGYDINCGVRLLVSDLNFDDIKEALPRLAKELYKAVPSGVGRGGQLKLTNAELDRVLKTGVKWALEKGYAKSEDLSQIESQGGLAEADPAAVSEHAKNRGRDQLGTMGAGNHFVEVGRVEQIFDEELAKKFGLSVGQITILIHCGSRGLGHQVATDYIRQMLNKLSDYKIVLPDRELSCVPFTSPEGQAYFAAMSAAANFAWTNRQLITHQVRGVWQKVFGAGLKILYDVSHNIAKIETYAIGGIQKKLVIHRKGATRAFPGQPVLIPGSMGTASYVLVGSEGAMQKSFGSTCHGAGRQMSRSRAIREINGRQLKIELEKSGTFIEAGSVKGLAEEAPQAYKDVHEVVDVVDRAGIAKKVVSLKPVAVVKG